MAQIFNTLLTLFFAIVLILFISSCSLAHDKREDKSLLAALQLIIEHPDLQKYLHPDVEGRTPLVIKTSSPSILEMKLKVYDRPIIIKREINQKAFIEVLNFSKNGADLNFLLSYDIEGIEVAGQLSLTDSVWNIIYYRITEH